MFLSLSILLVISFLYGIVLLLNDYLSSKPDSNFLSPIIMSLSGVMFLMIPMHIGLSLKTHILCILFVNVVGYAIYYQFKVHKK